MLAQALRHSITLHPLFPECHRQCYHGYIYQSRRCSISWLLVKVGMASVGPCALCYNRICKRQKLVYRHLPRSVFSFAWNNFV